jgi:pSer/pThr/pTyr-binding forkhead associated (FHA) protein
VDRRSNTQEVTVTDVQKAKKVIPVPTLHFSDGNQAGRTIRLDAEVGTIGRREDNTYVLQDPRVSRVHAELRRVASAVIVMDLDSSAGTSVNGEPITGPRSLHHGDRVGFGPVVAVFEDPAIAAQHEDETLVLTMPKPDEIDMPHLSNRQLEVLQGMAQGKTNSEIGADLGVTERTVKAYAQELFDKLGARNRAGAVAEAARLHIL